MTPEEQLQKNRMIELSRRAEQGGYYTATSFLTLAEQSDLAFWQREGALGAFTLVGGYEAAERKLALFGDPDSFGYLPTAPCTWLAITPIAQKFADALTHRDFLGSIMGLGIRRDVLGDILVFDNVGYLYCEETIAPYLAETLTKIKHTDVTCHVIDTPPKQSAVLPDVTLIVTAGERLDAFVSSVFHLSRSESASLCEKGLVAVNGKPITKPSATPPPFSLISVRGHGRFRYDELLGDTRKGKLRIAVRIFS